MSAPPERPCDDVRGRDVVLGEARGYAPDFVERTAHEGARLGPVDRLLVFGVGLFTVSRRRDHGRHRRDDGQVPVSRPLGLVRIALDLRSGKFAVFGTGSIFPTHTFYARGASYGQQDELTDAAFMRSWRHPLTIDTSTLRVYPVLTVGATASGPQSHLIDRYRARSVRIVQASAIARSNGGGGIAGTGMRSRASEVIASIYPPHQS